MLIELLLCIHYLKRNRMILIWSLHRMLVNQFDQWLCSYPFEWFHYRWEYLIQPLNRYYAEYDCIGILMHSRPYYKTKENKEITKSSLIFIRLFLVLLQRRSCKFIPLRIGVVVVGGGGVVVVDVVVIVVNLRGL